MMVGMCALVHSCKLCEFVWSLDHENYPVTYSCCKLQFVTILKGWKFMIVDKMMRERIQKETIDDYCIFIDEDCQFQTITGTSINP